MALSKRRKQPSWSSWPVGPLVAWVGPDRPVARRLTLRFCRILEPLRVADCARGRTPAASHYSLRRLSDLTDVEWRYQLVNSSDRAETSPANCCRIAVPADAMLMRPAVLRGVRWAGTSRSRFGASTVIGCWSGAGGRTCRARSEGRLPRCGVARSVSAWRWCRSDTVWTDLTTVFFFGMAANSHLNQVSEALFRPAKPTQSDRRCYCRCRTGISKIRSQATGMAGPSRPR